MLELEFEAEIIEWRGPAPFFYAPLPAAEAAEVEAVKKRVTYGWGVIPVETTINGVTFSTSLFPKDGTFLLPLKLDVRRRAGITLGDRVAVSMRVGPEREPAL